MKSGQTKSGRLEISLVFTGLSCALLFAGCTAGPNYHRPSYTLPAEYRAASTAPVTYGPPAPTTRPLDLARWWEALHDSELDSLLDRAVASNLDLQVAIDRLQAARSQEAVFFGSELPSLRLSGTAGIGTGNSQARSGNVDGPLNVASDTAGLRQVTHVLGVDTYFDTDLFGGLRREGQAVSADAAAAGEFRNQVLVTLLGDVARGYIAIRTLQARLDIAQQAIDSESKNAGVVRDRYQRGITNELDSELADRELATTQATLEPLRANLLAEERQLSVLLGEAPDELMGELNNRQDLPVPPTEVDEGLPGDLLRRRPDVRQAEAQLIASNARLGVATAALYPRLVLSAAGGVEGQGLGRKPDVTRSIWDFGPSIFFPLLDFGVIDAQIQAQDQETRASVANYRKTILLAVEDVENNLSNYDAERSRLMNLTNAVDAARRAFNTANQRYERGLTDFLYVVDAERQLFSLEDQQAVSQNSSVSDFIGVCQSLGGGWQGYAPPAPLKAPLPAIFATFRDAAGTFGSPTESLMR